LVKNSDNSYNWEIINDSSVNTNGETQYIDLKKYSNVSPGGMWNTGYYITSDGTKTIGGTIPGMLFTISFDKFYNAAYFIMNQIILNRGPDNPKSCLHNCWGYCECNGMAAGEIDILETPFWSCAYHQNTPNLCNDND